MNFCRSLCFVALLSLAGSSFAATNPWFGTWRLNREKSTIIGDTYTISKVGDSYSEEFGGVRFKYKEDGHDYPTMPSHTVSVTKLGDGKWLQLKKANGTETSRTALEVSADGKTLTSHITGVMADGTKFSEDVTDVRIGPGHGLAGTWKTMKDSSSQPETLLYRDAGDGNGSMRMESVESKSVIITHFDGKPAPATGPRAQTGQALAVRATSATSYTWTLSMKGKPFAKGINTISGDGTYFKEVNLLITKPRERYAMIYERQ